MPRSWARTRARSATRAFATFEQLAGRVADTWRLATVDPLTGVANRQALLMRADEELGRAARYKRPLAVVMVDLDHFKRLNDTHGHEAGDVVLRTVAQRLAENVRAVDLLGRFGGEEFLLVLPETDADDAAATVAEKLRRIVARTPVRLPDSHEVTVTLSAGVAGGPGEILGDMLLRDADAALYSAKALGRNAVYVFRETRDENTVRRSPIRAEARNAADRRREGRDGRGPGRAAPLARALARARRQAVEAIAEASLAMAQAIDLPQGELDRLRTASLLHDLGKLAIPEEILNKPADLAASEWRVVTEHPKIGQVVLEQAGALRDAAMIVLHHHEWFDGRGYPYGLAGIDIPVGARIVAICDAYEAMIAGRPYREAVSHEEAIAELRRMAGVQFDPELVEVFAEQFPAGVPWKPETHDGPHLHAVGGTAPKQATRSIAAAHDKVHATRRRAG
ncbi:MAG: diguanylate cyclase [Chloroflexota bacterium]